MAQTILLTILCICSFLQLIAIIAAFIIFSSHGKTSNAAVPASKAPHLSDSEEEELRRQRKKFDDEMEAFQQILNYNADVAYGTASIKER